MPHKPNHYNPKHFKMLQPLIEKAQNPANLPFTQTCSSKGRAIYIMQKLHIYYNVVVRDYRENGEEDLANMILQNKPIMKVGNEVLYFRKRPEWRY